MKFSDAEILKRAQEIRHREQENEYRRHRRYYTKNAGKCFIYQRGGAYDSDIFIRLLGPSKCFGARVIMLEAKGDEGHFLVRVEEHCTILEPGNRPSRISEIYRAQFEAVAPGILATLKAFALNWS